jgi:CheY-like chemotaxis protein
MNLVINGGHAMEERGGRLDVAVSCVAVSEAMAARELELSPGSWVRLTVRDEGRGIDAATRARMFEPFFTTRQLGRGVGLGLAVAHGVVKSHGGAILVRSEPGRGSTFEVYLPVHDGAPAPAVTPPDAVPRGHGERVLFVDDEAPLAELGRRVLEGLGYRVTALTDPVRAATLFRSEPDAFDLVVTDLMMPALSGTELALEVLRIRPSMPILVITADEANVPPDLARRIGLAGVITKPNTMDVLARAVRGALAGTA